MMTPSAKDSMDQRDEKAQLDYVGDAKRAEIDDVDLRHTTKRILWKLDTRYVAISSVRHDTPLT
jgi:hypothetical protein